MCYLLIITFTIDEVMFETIQNKTNQMIILSSSSRVRRTTFPIFLLYCITLLGAIFGIQVTQFG